MQTIAIVDYGMGNVRSVQKALEYVAPNDECILTNDPKVIRDSDRVVFPGQGAMGSCMRALESNDLISEIKLSSESKPFLGICLGLQLLFGYSEENNGTNGLSIVPGDVVKFNNKDLKIPHMGWNNVNQVKNHPLGIKLIIIAVFIVSIVITLTRLTLLAWWGQQSMVNYLLLQ